jgi:Hypoxia induced protein conserved region.
MTLRFDFQVLPGMEGFQIQSTLKAFTSIWGTEVSIEGLMLCSEAYCCFSTGLAGLTLACLYGVYKYKHRGTMSTSVFLMQLRVGAQGTVVACLTAGIAYSLFREYLMKSDEVKKN